MKRTRKKYPDLTGTFGRLTIRFRLPNSDTRHAIYFVDCECGGEKTVRGSSLRSGDTLSCGCFQRECAAKRGPENTKHGFARSSEKSKTYQAWRDARHHYDGVPGSFETFLRAVGFAPSSRSRLRHSKGTYQWTTT